MENSRRLFFVMLHLILCILGVVSVTINVGKADNFGAIVGTICAVFNILYIQKHIQEYITENRDL